MIYINSVFVKDIRQIVKDSKQINFSLVIQLLYD